MTKHPISIETYSAKRLPDKKTSTQIAHLFKSAYPPSHSAEQREKDLFKDVIEQL